MSQNDQSSEARAAFRSFSFELESRLSVDGPSNQLARAVVEERNRDDQRAHDLAQWRKYFEPWPVSEDPDLKALDIEGNELSDAWARLREKLPSDTQIEFAKRPQSVEDVITVVQRIEEDWQLKKQKGAWGRAKTNFRRVCSVLESHKTLLEILPSSSQYASVFCGTLQTLIKASANYEKIAAGLARALLEITEAVDACVRESARYDTTYMRHNIANLYAHIFFFLRGAISWYTRKSARRLLSSFKEDFYEEFEDQISNIRRISDSVNREAQQGLGSEVRYTRMTVEDFREDTVIGLQGLHRETAMMRYQNERAEEQRAKDAEATRKLTREGLKKLDDLQCVMVNSAKAIFLGDASEFLARSKVLQKDFKAIQDRQTQRNFDIKPFQDEVSKDDIQLYSRHLENFFDNKQTMIEYEKSPNLSIDWHVVAALQEWTTSSSEVLCIFGPSKIYDPSPMSMIAAEYVLSARRLGIPVISFFCALPQKQRLGIDIPEVEGLISLAYSLIRQLIELLPSMTQIPQEFGQQRFALLDGSLDSWKDAMTVLDSLLNLSPPVLLCVIDGFEELEHKSTTHHLKIFLETIRSHKKLETPRQAETDRRLKILFTTCGGARCLLDDLSRDELIFAEQSSAGRRPGKPAPGRRSLSPENLKELQSLRM